MVEVRLYEDAGIYRLTLIDRSTYKRPVFITAPLDVTEGILESVSALANCLVYSVECLKKAIKEENI